MVFAIAVMVYVYSVFCWRFNCLKLYGFLFHFQNQLNLRNPFKIRLTQSDIYSVFSDFENFSFDLNYSRGCRHVRGDVELQQGRTDYVLFCKIAGSLNNSC
jgi:hypothetical protein